MNLIPYPPVPAAQPRRFNHRLIANLLGCLTLIAAPLPSAIAQPGSAECRPAPNAPPIRTKACKSAQTVFTLWNGREVRAGRGLQKPAGLDEVAAARELSAAGKDAEFRTLLDAELSKETDPLNRVLIEAAWLHDFGHYKARDLVLHRAAAAGIGRP